MKLRAGHTQAACYTGSITQAANVNLAPLLFVTFQQQFQLSLEQIGFLVTFNFTIQIITDFIAAKFADRIGYRPSVVLAHVCSALGLVGLGIFPFLFPNAYAGLLASVLLCAFGGGLLEVLISPIMEALPTENKAAAMGLLHSFYCIGHVGVVLLSTLFFAVVGLQHWYLLPLLWAILPLLNCVAFSKVPLYPLPGSEHPHSFRRLFGIKVFWLFLLLMLCSGAAEQAMAQWASLFAETGLHVSKTTGDLLGPCLFAVLMGLSRLLYSKFGSSYPLKPLLGGSALLCVASYLITVFAPHPLLSLAGCALCGFSVGIMWPGVLSLSSQTCPTGGTAMFAFLALAGDIGCAGGPGLVGFISDTAGGALKLGLGFALVFPVIMLFGLFILRKTHTNS